MRAVWSVVWRVGLFFLAFGVLAASLLLPFAAALERWAGAFPLRGQLYAGTAGLVAMLAATWVMTRFIDRRPFATIGFAPRRAPRDLAMGLAVGTAWLAGSIGIAWAAGWVSLEVSAEVSAPVLALAALFVLVNVLTQQLLLCGYVLQTVRSWSNFGIALLVSAALFAAYHAGAFQGAWLPAVNVFAAGALFCLAYGVTENLWLPTAIHFAWNFLLGPVLGLTVSGSEGLSGGWHALVIDGPALFTGGAFGLEGGLVVTMTTAAAIGAMALSRRRQVRRQDRRDAQP